MAVRGDKTIFYHMDRPYRLPTYYRELSLLVESSAAWKILSRRQRYAPAEIASSPSRSSVGPSHSSFILLSFFAAPALHAGTFTWHGDVSLFTKRVTYPQNSIFPHRRAERFSMIFRLSAQRWAKTSQQLQAQSSTLYVRTLLLEQLLKETQYINPY